MVPSGRVTLRRRPDEVCRRRPCRWCGRLTPGNGADEVESPAPGRSWLAWVPRPAPSQTRPCRPGSRGAIWASEARAKPISSLGQWSKSSSTRPWGSGLRPITKQVFRPRTCLPRLVGRSGLVPSTGLAPPPGGLFVPAHDIPGSVGEARRGFSRWGEVFGDDTVRVGSGLF